MIDDGRGLTRIPCVWVCLALCLQQTCTTLECIYLVVLNNEAQIHTQIAIYTQTYPFDIDDNSKECVTLTSYMYIHLACNAF